VLVLWFIEIVTIDQRKLCTVGCAVYHSQCYQIQQNNSMVKRYQLHQSGRKNKTYDPSLHIDETVVDVLPPFVLVNNESPVQREDIDQARRGTVSGKM
jgi:hypothetical protein